MRDIKRITSVKLAAILFSLVPATVMAADEKPKVKSDRVRFETVDEVEIHGTFYPSSRGGKAPVVICLHNLKSKASAGGWGDLAADLQKAGYAVLTFDFRGHGASTSVGAKFWSYKANITGVRGFRAGNPPKTISHVNFTPQYFPYLTNDINAAKTFLEQKNDANQCNASNIILIGAEEGATLGALWLAGEAKRYRLFAPGMPDPKPQAKDVVAGIWLTMSTKIDRLNVKRILPVWLREAGKNQEIPMAFVYGVDDKVNNPLAEKMVKLLRPQYKRKGKVPAPNGLTETGDRGIAGTKLKGSKLLIDALDTRDWIVNKYLEGPIKEKHSINTWERRTASNFPYAWYPNRQLNTRSFIPAKGPGEKANLHMPMKLVGLPSLDGR